MSKQIVIGVFVGSLRRESFNQKIAKAFCGLMPETFDMRFIEIGHLQMFNQDYDDDGRPPQEWVLFREEVKALDGLLFVTPEYNRSIPPVLKNALDIGSRPVAQNVWAKKPGAIISVSIGKPGAFGANHHLRQPMVYLDVYMMQQPEAYLGSVASSFNEDGSVTERTMGFLQKFADGFVDWVTKFV